MNPKFSQFFVIFALLKLIFEIFDFVSCIYRGVSNGSMVYLDFALDNCNFHNFINL